MDKASDFRSKDCEFRHGQISVILEKNCFRKTDWLICFTYSQNYDFNVFKKVTDNAKNVISSSQLKENTRKFLYS